jgi:hypothetical protein
MRPPERPPALPVTCSALGSRNPEPNPEPESRIPSVVYRGAGFDRYAFEAASSLIGVTLSGSIRTIR